MTILVYVQGQPDVEFHLYADAFPAVNDLISKENHKGVIEVYQVVQRVFKVSKSGNGSENLIMTKLVTGNTAKKD